ncbi:unnamed protein product [Sympodiomycopsis kandeliae]
MRVDGRGSTTTTRRRVCASEDSVSNVRFWILGPPLVTGPDRKMSSDQDQVQESTAGPSSQSMRGPLNSSQDESPSTHFSLPQFTELIRQIDRAASSSSDYTGSAAKKRKLTPLSGTSSTSIEGRISSLARKAGKPSNSKTYSPFSKARLLDRIATYQLSTYNVRLPPSTTYLKLLELSPQEEVHASNAISALGRWLDPIGPALHGWTHIQPREVIKRQGQENIHGAKNKLYCATCHFTLMIFADAQGQDTLPLLHLIHTVQSLHTGHAQWCAWKKRRCDTRLYRLSSDDQPVLSEADGNTGGLFLGHQSKMKAQSTFTKCIQNLEESLGSDTIPNVEIIQPSDLSNEDFASLRNLLPPSSTTPLRSVTILLTLFGWQPLSSSTKGLFHCSHCSRKIHIPFSAQATKKTLNVKLEHRKFCPWIRSESSSLWPFTSNFSSSEEVQDLKSDLLNWSSLQDQVEVQAGWEINLHTLLDRQTNQIEGKDDFVQMKEKDVVLLLDEWFRGVKRV